MLVATVEQYAVVRAMQDEESQELHEAIEYMSERQLKLLSTKERKQKLMGEKSTNCETHFAKKLSS